MVEERAASYDPPKTEWFEEWFLPTLNSMELRCLTWEGIVDFMKAADRSFGSDLEQFYSRCLKFNRGFSGSQAG